jgi:hypothetical protein
VQYGQPATIQAVLRTVDNHPVAGVHVVLQGKRDGGGLWGDLGAWTTSASGVVNAVHTPTAQTSYRFVFATTGNALGSTSPVATVTVEIPPALVYTTIGYHTVAGRQWYTSCEPYSSTSTRCEAQIWATVVERTASGYAVRTTWVFNNLTYQGTAGPDWDANPLARTGTFTSSGRKWKVSCTPNVTSGPRTCRAYVWATRATRTLTSSGYRYYTVTGWVFNDIVILS